MKNILSIVNYTQHYCEKIGDLGWVSALILFKLIYGFILSISLTTLNEVDSANILISLTLRHEFTEIHHADFEICMIIFLYRQL